MTKSFFHFKRILLLVAFFLGLECLSINAYAKEGSLLVNGSAYEFEENAHYEFSGSEAPIPTTEYDTFGTFSIVGDMSSAGSKGTIPAYTVQTGNVAFYYSFAPTRLTAEATEWHLISDKSKKVNDLELEKNIQNGTVIVQSSPDGNTWITDTVLSDVFTESSDLSSTIYQTKDIQLINGCYYRVIIVYKLQTKTGEKKVLFVTTDETETKKVAEVYEFYVISNETANSGLNIESTPRMKLGEKIKVKTDSGYSLESHEALDKNDPHFGWDLGAFVINGYTDTVTAQDGTPIFLKTVGDKVTLWFSLEQDINCLNGKNSLTIAEDNNGYDIDTEVPQTNFKRGTLIIRFTDHENNTKEPIIYTDFLAANFGTTADTRVQLFEEGDYEVTLDYEIKNNPRQVGPISIVPTYTNYKITFQFKIRNGNNMFFPFDAVTGSELADKVCTPNGFRVDLAGSQYLKLHVTRYILEEGSTGNSLVLKDDVRTNSVTNSSTEFKAEGIYTIRVASDYTSDVEKTIYVGTNKYLLALAKNRLTLEALNAKLAEGATVEDDGTISNYVPEPTPEPTPIPTVTPEPISTQTPEPQPTPNTIVTDITVKSSVPVSVFFAIFGVAFAIVVGIVVIAVKHREEQDEQNEQDELENEDALTNSSEQETIDEPVDPNHQ